MFDITEEDVGLYWCQIAVFENMNGSTTTNKLQPSVFTVLDNQEVYRNCAVCPDVYLFSVGLECADIDAVVASSPDSISIPIPSPSPTVSEPTTEVSNRSGNPLWIYVAIPIGGLVVVVLVVGAILLAARKVYLRTKQKYTRDSTTIGRPLSLKSHAIPDPPSADISQPGVHNYSIIYETISNDSCQGQTQNRIDLEYASGYTIPDFLHASNEQTDTSYCQIQHYDLTDSAYDPIQRYELVSGACDPLQRYEHVVATSSNQASAACRTDNAGASSSVGCSTDANDRQNECGERMDTNGRSHDQLYTNIHSDS